ncbi:UDP-glycosyltransferase 91A1-like [Cornus florida]|uniref:UDP-glycosyltransferase 91A1-like n=1 Tax=Cornus florida TaxID=4283 RepID=UPI0028A202C2|nr:UDP-glycosyltransferase 91A1-like [Cornus florida]
MESTPPSTMAETGKLHIVMFPWLAFGHMLPFLEVSRLIAQKGHKISFVSTPRNIDRLPKLPPSVAHLINFVKLPLPHVQNLPENAESTSDLPYHMVKYLKRAYDLLQQPLTSFLEASSPDWVIYDMIPYWVGVIAAKLHISSALFFIFIASSMTYAGPASLLLEPQNNYRKKPEDFTVPPNWIPFKSTVAFRLFEIMRVFDEVEGDGEGGVPGFYRVGKGIEDCDVMIVRSSYEFEPEWLRVLGDIHRPKPVIPVGQLPAISYHDDDEDPAWREMKKWLDEQSKGSVVYVAFGSEAKPTQDELTEIALGLELSELPFFWVLRKRRGMADTEVIELPEGFEERTRGRGWVCTGWAPQFSILSHDSVGGFLTHSGWSSVVEGIQFGRALILLTFLAEQGLNARVLEEKRMGYSIPRDELDGSFTSDSVAESLRLVMVEEGGKLFRDKAEEMRALFGDRNTQDKYVDNLLAHFQSHKKGGTQEVNLSEPMWV